MRLEAVRGRTGHHTVASLIWGGCEERPEGECQRLSRACQALLVPGGERDGWAVLQRAREREQVLGLGGAEAGSGSAM